MFSTITTINLLGLEAKEVAVEVDIRNGLFSFNIVGLAGKSVQEAKERVFSAIKNSGFEMPMRRITVNLSPADITKNSSNFDLPIAFGILIATRQIDLEIEKSVIWGELSLAGMTVKSKGALAVADYAKNRGYKHLILPAINATEAGIVAGITPIPISNLSDAQEIPRQNANGTFTVKSMRNPAVILREKESIESKVKVKTEDSSNYDFALLKGQHSVRRVAEIAAAGGHNMLLNGVPGSGKTFLGRCIAGILPTMQFQEKIEVTKIHSITGLLQDEGLIEDRPFRSPHHTSSDVALIGGGSIPKPGEITLSHRGVLFLDEFNEFPSKVLESLRQPIEDKIVHISRSAGSVTYPANFMLVAAMNPCKCGFYGESDQECICTKQDLEKFKRKISGPILDRIDLQVYVKKVKNEDLLSEELSESSQDIRKRVERAREIQIERFKSHQMQGMFANSELGNSQVRKLAKFDSVSNRLLEDILNKMNLSARGYFRLLKVSRTIADLERSEVIRKEHLTEAVSYRIVI